MNIILVGSRLVVVDDVGNVFNINTPGGNVGGDEDVDDAIFELAEDVFALILPFVAVDGTGAKARLDQIFTQIFDAVLGAAENEDFAELFFGQHFAKEVGFLDFPESLDDVLGHILSSSAGFDRDFDGIDHKLPGHRLDLGVDRRRKQQGLTLLGKQGE